MITTSTHPKHINRLLAIPIIIIIIIVVWLQFDNEHQTASPIAANDSTAAISERLDSTIETLDSLKPLVTATIQKIKYYETLRNNYQQQVSAYVYEPASDNTSLNDLRKKLNDANREIIRLNGELREIKTAKTFIQFKKPDTVFTEKVDAPNENSILVDLDTKGIPLSENITIYLIPYSKRVKKLMMYEASCDESIIHKNDYKIAKQYKGVYYFNSVPPGKYLVKICTYYGNYKVINKSDGKEVVKMKVAPPLQ